MANEYPIDATEIYDQEGQIIYGGQTNVAGDFHLYVPQTSHVPLHRPTRSHHFVDREIILNQLLKDLQPGQIVTLCGPGGIGKSAVAAELIWRLAPRIDQPPSAFPDGILYHDFYRANQITQVFEQIVRSFGENLRPTPQLAAQRALAGRRLLLLLDGAEKADNLPALLAICSGCGVLITSQRHSDAVTVRYDLEPLPVVEANDLLRAWSQEPAIELTTSGTICELVGWLPLAVRMIGRYLHQQAIQATEYLEWLKSTPLAALDMGQRQDESIPCLMERSLEKVSTDARTTLSIVGCLAFAPFDRAVVAEALGMPAVATQRPLGELVNYSFLQRGDLLRGDKNYCATHALIHTYARERIVPTAIILIRIVQYYTDAVKVLANDFDQINKLRPHIVAVLQSCQARGIWQPVKKLAWSIDPFLGRQGYWNDRLAVINVAIAAAQIQKDQHEEASWLGTLGATYQSLGKVEDALIYYKQALAMSRKISDYKNEGMQLGNLGNAFWLLGKFRQSINYYKQGLLLSEKLNDFPSIANHLGNLSNVHRDLGQTDVAIRYLERAMKVSRTIGDRTSLGKHLGNLGIILRQRGQVKRAIELYQQALSISRESHDLHSESNHLGELGIAYYEIEQFDKAIEFYRLGLAISQQIGNRREEATHLANLGNLYFRQGQLENARERWRAALHIYEEIKSPTAEHVRTYLAKIGDR